MFDNRQHQHPTKCFKHLTTISILDKKGPIRILDMPSKTNNTYFVTAPTMASTSTAVSDSSKAAISAQHSLKRARIIFSNASGTPKNTLFVPRVDEVLHSRALTRKRLMLYGSRGTVSSGDKDRNGTATKSSSALVVSNNDNNGDNKQGGAGEGAIVIAKNAKKSKASVKIPTPKWHAPWRLSTVISAHLGWVRSIAFDPTNDMFATGGADSVIKIFDTAKACVGAEDALKLTLTGHLNAIRGMVFSDRHPYLFSAGEDKMVKCWDLETNQVIRHYHGHLSGVFALKMHPTLDILVTGGRDAVARVWDMRSRYQIHCLAGHENTVGSILTKPTDPQVITGSYDNTIKLWDLAAGKCMTTLTHHKKAIRALAMPSFENTFMSGAADVLKKWQAKDGRLIKNMSGHNSVINALAINDDGVAVSAADDGTMNFWDYHTGYCFQKSQTIPQPGSLDAENGIFAAEFDLTGTRLITGETDKTIKIWKQDENASEISDPIDMVSWRKQCLAEARQRY